MSIEKKEEEDYKFMDDEEELNGVMEYEYKNVQECGILEYGFEVKLPKENDYKKWLLLMKAPEDSDYKDGKYIIEVQFLMDYPYINPKFTFKEPILYHCNVKDNGELDVNWMMKGMKIDYIMPRLLTLFYLQDTEGNNSERSKLYQENKNKFLENIKKNVEETKNVHL